MAINRDRLKRIFTKGILAFLLGCAMAVVLGILLIVVAAHTKTSEVSHEVYAGLGIAFFTTGLVVAPLTLVAHWAIDERTEQFRHDATDKLLAESMGAELFASLKEKTLSVKRLEVTKFKVALTPVEGHNDALAIRFERNYVIANRDGRKFTADVRHTSSAPMGPLANVPGWGFDEVVFELDRIGHRLETILSLTPINGTAVPSTFKKWGRVRSCGELDPESGQVLLFDASCEIPDGASLRLAVSSTTIVPPVGWDSLSTPMPTDAIEVDLSWPAGTAVVVRRITTREGTVLPEPARNPRSEGGRLVQELRFPGGFFPGQGIIIRWWPEDSATLSNAPGLRGELSPGLSEC